VVNCRVNTRSLGRPLDLPLCFSASRCALVRMMSLNSGLSVVKLYLLFLPDSSMTTCMLFLRDLWLIGSPPSSSASSKLLPSDGIAVVPLLPRSLLLSFARGLSRLESSMSERSDVAPGVHESRLSSGGRLDSPWKACDMVDCPSVIDVRSGFELLGSLGSSLDAIADFTEDPVAATWLCRGWFKDYDTWFGDVRPAFILEFALHRRLIASVPNHHGQIVSKNRPRYQLT